MQIINQIYFAEGRLPGRNGNRYESTYPYDTFPTKDGREIVIGCANDKFWQIVCDMMGREDLKTHPDMDINRKRVKNHAMVRPIVEEWTRTQDADALVDKLLEKGVPSCPIYTVEQVASDPQIAGAREMFIEEEYPKVGKLKVTNTHIKMSETKPGFHAPSPVLGQDNADVYTRVLGYSQEKLDRLKAAKII
jgi:formyl-CoA transferase